MPSELTVELIDIDKIKPYPNNAKLHPPEQVATLAKLIKTFGWTQPIVVDSAYVIIVGHGRRLAAISLGLSKVPVVVRNDLSLHEAMALRLGDNRSASQDYDFSKIQGDINILIDAAELDIDLTGFSSKELEALTTKQDEIDPSVFAEDIGAAVDEQRNENAAAAAAIDESASPIGDAFGFKRVTVAQSRRIREHMSYIEAITTKKGAEALLAYFDSQRAAASVGQE
jgi:ParB-like chromosome segregation protein Spo0J